MPIPTLSCGAVAMAALLPAASHASWPASSAPRPISCSVIPAGAVADAYHASFSPPAATTKGSITVCSYTHLAPVITVLVQFDAGETSSQFLAMRRAFERDGEHTVTVSGYGQMAFSVVLGTGKTTVSTIAVLDGSTAVTVTGTGALSKAEALARRILATL